jgi:SAM-dependent methyltransferase
MNTRKVQLDLGCGAAKRPWHIGIDKYDMPGVDHVLDLAVDPLPFDDDSVDEVFSSHFLELVPRPDHLFSEIGRVCRDGARIEFWTPYAWTNEALLYGHAHLISEEMWLHLGVTHRDAYAPMLGGRWLLRRFVYVVDEKTIHELEAHHMDLSFAVRHLTGVVHEFGVEIEYRDDLEIPARDPEYLYATERGGPRSEFEPVSTVPLFRDDVRVLLTSVRARVRARVQSMGASHA